MIIFQNLHMITHGIRTIGDKNMSNWGEYYLNIAGEVAKNSKCYSRKIGSVLVKNNVIVSTGYNGPPARCRKCSEWKKSEGWPIDNSEEVCPRRVMGFKSGEGIQYCPACHSERNTILLAALNGISTKDTTLFCRCGVPCFHCAVELINAGVGKIVCLKKDKDYDPYGRLYFKEAGISVVEVEL
jgi:dCMP deaminase